MDEIKGLLGKVSEGLQALGDIFIALGKQFERKAEIQKAMEAEIKSKKKETKDVQGKAKEEKKPKKAPQSEKKRAAKKKSGTSPVTKKSGEIAAAYTIVFDIIKASEDGVDVAGLMAKTGFDSKKIANCIYKLKNNQLVKTTRKGFYTAI